MMYEKSDGFRQYFWLERYGINPTFTYKVDPMTTLKFSYEYFHDNRTADRGNPSQATLPTGSTKQNPGFPFSPNGDLQAFYGSPSLNVALANVHTWMGFIDHDFGNGLTVKNGTYYAEYDKFYQNVYPGNGPLSGAVNPADTSFNRAAYNNTTNRNNFFNQTDFFYKVFTGPVYHSIAFGTEFGRQIGISVRNTGIFPNGTKPKRITRLVRAISGRSVSSTSPSAVFARGDGPGRQQQIQSQHTVGVRPRYDRYYALVASHRSGPLRPL